MHLSFVVRFWASNNAFTTTFQQLHRACYVKIHFINGTFGHVLWQSYVEAERAQVPPASEPNTVFQIESNLLRVRVNLVTYGLE